MRVGSIFLSKFELNHNQSPYPDINISLKPRINVKSSPRLLKSRSTKVTSRNKILLILSLRSMLEITRLSLTYMHTHSLAHCLIKGGQSEGQQYFYTEKCGVEVALETQNKLALSPALTLTSLYHSFLGSPLRLLLSVFLSFYLLMCPLSYLGCFYCFNAISHSLCSQFSAPLQFYLSVFINLPVFRMD